MQIKSAKDLIVYQKAYELAMENSNRPETHALARKMSELVDCPPTYGNYDVIDG